MVTGEAGGYKGFPFSSWMNAKNLYSREVVYRTARDERYQVPCYGGLLAGNVFNNGEVSPCELLDRPFGNLRDHDYDFVRLWRSPAADRVRRHIRETKCFCTHECFLNTSLLFNPRNLPPIAARWIRIKTRGRLFPAGPLG
jgi:MoaA/NifB/PqqE/SkfB family radical SAM enzyme